MSHATRDKLIEDLNELCERYGLKARVTDGLPDWNLIPIQDPHGMVGLLAQIVVEMAGPRYPNG